MSQAALRLPAVRKGARAVFVVRGARSDQAFAVEYGDVTEDGNVVWGNETMTPDRFANVATNALIARAGGKSRERVNAMNEVYHNPTHADVTAETLVNFRKLRDLAGGGGGGGAVAMAAPRSFPMPHEASSPDTSGSHAVDEDDVEDVLQVALGGDYAPYFERRDDDGDDAPSFLPIADQSWRAPPATGPCHAPAPAPKPRGAKRARTTPPVLVRDRLGAFLRGPEIAALIDQPDVDDLFAAVLRVAGAALSNRDAMLVKTALRNAAFRHRKPGSGASVDAFAETALGALAEISPQVFGP